MLQVSFSEQSDLPTSLLCFILFTGYLLSRGSNANCLCFKIISHQAPIYLSELLHLYTPSRQFRSSTYTRVFRIPSFRTKSCGQRSFSYHVPIIWNQLPVSVRHSTSVSSFKSSLKTFLFLKPFLQSHCPDRPDMRLVCESLCVCVRVCVCVHVVCVEF